MINSNLRRLRRHPMWVFWGGVLVAACTTVGVETPINFSHHLHTENEVGCEDCHTTVAQDAEIKVEQLSMDVCSDCHDVEDDETCGTCHVDADDPQSWNTKTDRHLMFRHQVHEDVLDDCSMCHTGAEQAAALTPPVRKTMIPGHTECSECHQDELDGGNCRMCHDRLDLYQRKPEKVFSHQAGFFKQHGTKATGAESVCATCHDQSFCADCHNGTQTERLAVRFPERVDRQFIHRGDWISKHSFEAKTSAPTCQKCHGTSFCADCHERNGKGAALGGENPHPGRSVWLAGGPDGHGAAARKDIVACATCHDQGAQSNCVTCHRSGFVNPHPPGWKAPSSVDNRATHPNCRICHQ